MKKALSIACVMFSFGLAACGSSAEPVDMNESGNLADGAGDHDGHKCDSYDLTLGEGWTFDAAMTSEWDNMLYLVKGGEQVAMNDDGENGLNAHLTHTIADAGDYTLYACAYADGRGAYTLRVTSNGN